MLVVLLGAVAKHSQYDPLSQPGYLGKAVKMATARMDPNIETERPQCVESPSLEHSPTIGDLIVNTPLAGCNVPSFSLLAPPLLV